MRPPLIYALFIGVVVACGILIGINNIPGEWYQSLQKPPFNPPNWIFAPVWTTLYVMIGAVGARTFLHHRHTRAMGFWAAQMLFNFAWSPLFFGFHEIALALIVILALLISVYAFIAVSWRQDRLSAWLFVPYAVWVSFATLLNGSILLLN
ncbi:sensor histidine kinase [Rhizobium sp. Leaf384]|uniref:TspO/MBR family protein n=1 Tax=unclassified Rhizobium TaxID=2613769 RepID=UPI00071485B7|nr:MULTISPECIES: TspO/MBR family protein [unclassified Rhizobium]KQS81193.1 sensor histidine kinase [Rhizobium sp. Leaf384]KQS87101.1 sensor histidine kinase [Rhizobium sp. Leaf383]